MNHTSPPKSSNDIASSDFLRGVGFMVIVILSWSGWALSSRLGFKSPLNAYDIVALRIGVAGILLLPYLIHHGMRAGPYGRFGGCILSFVAGVPYLLLAIGAFKFAPASHVGILNAFTILVAGIGGMLFLNESRARIRIIGLVLILGGMAALITSHPGATAGYEHALLGHLLFVGAGTLWAIYTLLARAWKVRPLHGVAMVSGLSMLAYLPVYVLFLPKGIESATWDQIVWQAGYQGVVASIIALLAYTRAISILGASTTAAFVPLVPVLVAILAIPLLGELPNTQEWIGFAIIGVGVLAASGAVEWWQNKRRRTVPAVTQAPMG